MKELRLVGVHEDGEHLLLSGEGGSTYRLPINEALRMAGTRPLGERAVTVSAPPAGKPRVHLSPRDIQSRIRSGAAAQDIVDETGQDLEHVQRYEGPVRAERDYMAILAQRVEVSSPLPSHDGYRSAFGDNPARLGEMVSFRLDAYGVDAAALEWDAWRRPDGLWNVVAQFELAPGSRVSVGEEPPAQWTFNPARKTVLNTNRWAQLLSELEPLDGPLPARRLSAVADHVFDFEAQQAPEPAEDEDGSDNLLDVLRSRRGQRLGVDEDADDALATMLTKGSIPAAHPRTGEGEENGPAEEAAAETDAAKEDDDGGPGQRRFAGLSLAPSMAVDLDHNDARSNDPSYSDGTPRLFDGVSTDTREISIFARPSVPNRVAPDRDEHTPSVDTGSPKRSDEPADRKIRPKRSSVPSWDQIVFGTKSE